MFDLIAAVATAAAPAADLGILLTGLLLGIRHGIDWDHIAAITDITSTTAAAGHGRGRPRGPAPDRSGHQHGHGGPREVRAHDAGPGAAQLSPAPRRPADRRSRPGPGRPGRGDPPRHALRVGHGAVVIALGLAPSRSARCSPTGSTRSWAASSASPWSPSACGSSTRSIATPALARRSACAAAGCSCSTGSARLAPHPARLHGHEHVEPLEMSSYGAGTSFGVGMIHGVGAETGTQVLLIAAVGGASSAGLGVPMLFAFVIGLLISNFAIVILSSVGFVSSQAREQVYVAIGAVAGIFSLFVGTIFLFGLDGILPDLGGILPF